jgi:hypothetical protein
MVLGIAPRSMDLKRRQVGYFAHVSHRMKLFQDEDIEKDGGKLHYDDTCKSVMFMYSAYVGFAR